MMSYLPKLYLLSHEWAQRLNPRLSGFFIFIEISKLSSMKKNLKWELKHYVVSH